MHRILVVLDNCEHLLASCAQLADALLRGCPSLTILATSRAPLGIPGEITWRVPSMSLPTEPQRELIGTLRLSDAVSLFIDRATQVRPDFAITAANAPTVAQICHDLDGIPLATELAAARVRMLAPQQIARGLSDRSRLLTGGARTVLPRHQTLHASIDWSHELLSDGEQTLLRRLSVFAGGWTLDAAEQVCPGEGIDRYDVLDLLTALVDKSPWSLPTNGAPRRATACWRPSASTPRRGWPMSVRSTACVIATDPDPPAPSPLRTAARNYQRALDHLTQEAGLAA